MKANGSYQDIVRGKYLFFETKNGKAAYKKEHAGFYIYFNQWWKVEGEGAYKSASIQWGFIRNIENGNQLCPPASQWITYQESEVDPGTMVSATGKETTSKLIIQRSFILFNEDLR